MTRSILKSWCLAAMVFVVPARVLAVWPSSTSFVVQSEAPPARAKAEKLPAALHHNVQAVTSKLEKDELRLQKVLQDLKDDEAALKKLSQENREAHGGSNQ